jgi:ankyrin repeat protein
VGVIKVLLEARVDVNAADHEGWTALHVAASWQLYDVAVVLASSGRVEWGAQTHNGETACDLSLDPGFYNKILVWLAT